MFSNNLRINQQQLSTIRFHYFLGMSKLSLAFSSKTPSHLRDLHLEGLYPLSLKIASLFRPENTIAFRIRIFSSAISYSLRALTARPEGTLKISFKPKNWVNSRINDSHTKKSTGCATIHSLYSSRRGR